MMADVELANCDMCHVLKPVQRKYYTYDIKCDCCNNKEDDHFEIVRHCVTCAPKPPTKVLANLRPNNE